MEKRIVRDNSLSFYLYTLWSRTLFGWFILKDIKQKIEKIDSEDIKNSCRYKFWVVFNIFTLPLFLTFNLAQCLFAVTILLIGSIIVGGMMLAGFWFIFNEYNGKRVWGDKKPHLAYPYKYCPWTGSYLKFAPWQIILPLILLYSLFFLRGAIYKNVIIMISGMGMFFSEYIFWGVILFLLFFYFLFKIWGSEFVKELQEDIKRKYCIPVELVKTKKS